MILSYGFKRGIHKWKFIISAQGKEYFNFDDFDEDFHGSHFCHQELTNIAEFPDMNTEWVLQNSFI